MKALNPGELSDVVRYCKANRIKAKSKSGAEIVKALFLLIGESAEAGSLLKALRTTDDLNSRGPHLLRRGAHVRPTALR